MYRNKIKPLKYTTEEGRKVLKGADIIIVDGDTIVPKEIHQIVLHIVAALPGDEVLNSNFNVFAKDPDEWSRPIRKKMKILINT